MIVIVLIIVTVMIVIVLIIVAIVETRVFKSRSSSWCQHLKPLHGFVNSNTLVLGALVTPKLKWVPQVITSSSVTSEWFLTRVTSTVCSS